MDRDQKYQRALERIAECRKTQSNRLDLSGLIVDRVPDEVQTLDCLQILDLSFWSWDAKREEYDSNSEHGQLSSIPDWLMQLPLSDLRITGHKLNKLTPLSGLHSLQTLVCYFNQVSDLNPLSGLHSLQRLDCDNNQIRDLSPLNGLHNLKVLYCNSNQISDLNPLGGLHSLKVLNCESNQISDLSSLRGLHNLKVLYCNSNQISALNPLGGLHSLKVLICESNQISDLNPLSDLRRLQALSCHSNQVSDLSPLSGLRSLQTLHCSFNQISDLSPLTGLRSLQTLYCDSNQISDLCPLSGLHSLQTLNCYSNEIIDLCPLSGLHSLQTLHCSSNQISDLSPLHSLIESRQLETLYIHANPVIGLPAELLGIGTGSEMSADIRAFLLDLKQGARPNRAMKLLLVGNGCVGKTTLVKSLLSGQAASVPIQDRTHGIVIENWPLELDDGSTIELQLWDFGGQEIFHTTHRLFAQDRAVYLLLWAEQTDEDPLQTQHSVHYWLDFIEDLAPHSRILLLKNQIDRSDQYAFPPELNNDVSAFADQEKICALQAQGLETLTFKIKQQINALRCYWDFPFPQSWLTVQQQLAQRRADKTIAWSAFTALCEQAGMSNPAVLARYLHATGFLFYQHDKMDNRLILDQNWMIDLVYRVFDRREDFYSEIQRMDGVIPGTYTKRLWPATEQSERAMYLQFMCASHIAFEIAHQWDTAFEQREYVIPALLPETLNTPWPEPEYAPEWVAELQYAFLHRSMIERAIIALARLSVNRQWWRNGIRLQDPDNQCLLELDAGHSNAGSKTDPTVWQGVLRVHLHGGNNQAKASSFARVLNCLHNIHQQRKPQLAWSLNGVDFVTAEALQQARNAQQSQLASRSATVLELSVFAGIPDQFDDKDQFQPENAVSNPPKLFISYSHKDAEYKDELLNRLKVISRQLPVDSWHDRQLLAGDTIDSAIIQQLDAADVVLLLISPDFIASDYCFETEMQAGISHAKQRGSRVIAIIVRETPAGRIMTLANIWLYLTMPSR